MVTNKNQKTRKEFLPFCIPEIGEEEINEVADTLRSKWITHGKKTILFEEMFKNYIGCKHALAVNSCTSALHLSLVCAGIKAGDEVITTPFTFVATANVIVHQGAKPVLVDIQPDTYNLDPAKIEEKITKKTKAIIPVHYGGHPCDMDEILKIAKKHNLIVIEDAAHAVGASYKGKKIGTIGDFTCFSFYANKNLTTAEGGMITTNNSEWAKKLKTMRLHGISANAWNRYSSEGSWFYDVLYAGYKYNMNDVLAAIGIQQLKKFERMQKRRNEIAKRYNEGFKDTPELILPAARTYVEHAWHLYPVRLKDGTLKISRNEFISELKKENIGTSVHFIPVHMHQYYKKTFGFKEGELPVAENAYRQIISLPIFPSMTDSDINDVLSAVKKIIKNNKS